MPDGLERAIEQAKRQARIVCVFVYSGAEGRRGALWDRVWQDPAVQEWLAGHAVTAVLDGDEDASVVAEYSVLRFPTILFLGPDRRARCRITWPSAPEAFVEDAQTCIRRDPRVERLRAGLTGHEQDPRERERLGRDLLHRGLPREAEEHFFWCWDHGPEHWPGYSMTRLVFLWRDLERLAAADDRTRQQVVARRDRLRRDLRDRELATEPSFWACLALCTAAGEPHGVLEVWDDLDPDSALRNSLARWPHASVVDALCAAGRYEEVRDTWGPLGEWRETLVQTYRRSLAGELPHGARYSTRRAADDLARVHRVALGLGALAEACRTREAQAALALPLDTWLLLLQKAACSRNWAGVEEAARHVMDLLGGGTEWGRLVDLERDHPFAHDFRMERFIEQGREDGLRQSLKRGSNANEPLLSRSLARLSQGGPYVVATPPIVKAAQRARNLVPILLELGARVDAVEHPTGTSALHLAAAAGDAALVRELLERGATAGRKDAKGRTAGDRAANEETRSLLSRSPPSR